MYARASMLSVTTRGVGLGVCQLSFACHYDDNIAVPSIYAQFRVYLGLLEAKLVDLRGKFSTIPRHLEATYNNPGVTANFLWILKTCRFVPTPIKRLIDSVGIITLDEKVYLPVLANQQFDADGRFLPRPENTVLSTLRQTVLALADPETPQVVRTRYEHNNALPGARWQNHLLANPDMIIPDGYTIEDDFHTDSMVVASFVSQLQRHAPNLVEGALEQNALGRNSIFMSNDMGNLRCPDLRVGEEMPGYIARCIPEGNVNNYSSLHKLGTAETLEGQVNLLGEIPTEVNMIRPIYSLRDEVIHPYAMTLNYKSAVQFMYVSLTNI